jgi:hypothetical protein
MHMLLVTTMVAPISIPPHPATNCCASCTYRWRWRSAYEDREAALTLTAVFSG